MAGSFEKSLHGQAPTCRCRDGRRRTPTVRPITAAMTGSSWSATRTEICS